MEAGPEGEDNHGVGARAVGTTGHGDGRSHSGCPMQPDGQQTAAPHRLTHNNTKERGNECVCVCELEEAGVEKSAGYAGTGSMVPPGRGNEKFHMSLP